MIFENIEGLADWNIAPDWHANRAPGLSAMVRLKDEAEWILPSLESAAAFCDEIVVALQGEQTDGTDGIVRAWAASTECENVEILSYPFDSVPNGPGHGRQARGSVRERAYFYNWCLARTTRSHVVKWDGDMVAFDELGGEIRAALEAGVDFIRFKGVEIVDAHAWRVSATHPFANIETRVFAARPGVHFVTGDFCELLQGQGAVHDQATLDAPAYLHFKWAKARDSATKAWPENWREIDHFRNLAARAAPGAAWQGRIPAALRAAADA